MKRPIVLVPIVGVLLFATLTLLKSEKNDGSAPRDDGDLSAAQREQVRFWRVYREATSHRVAGRVAEAVAAYETALDINGRHQDVLYYLGNMYFVTGRFTEARELWERLVTVDPTAARGHSRLGDLHRCRQASQHFDLEQARAAYRRALEINKEETGPLLRLAEVAVLAGEEATARRYVDAVLGTNDRSVAAVFLQGYLAWRAGDRRRAGTLFARAVRFARPSQPERPEGTSAEGDTEKGAEPLTAQGGPCESLPLDGLNEITDDELTSEMARRYRAVDRLTARAP